LFTTNATEEEITLLHQDISNKVRYHRQDKGLSQLELALTIGMKSGAFYGNAENNKNGKHFNIEHLFKIAKALDIPLAIFFEVDGD
jgi:transcriptional regulator with XRE-family HTH domain